MKTQTQLKPRDQKLVINTVIICLLTLFSCKSQNANSDIIILEKVIEITNNFNEVEYNLREDINLDKNNIKRYYDYKYLNEPFYRVIKGYDIESDTIIYTKKNHIERKKNWDSKIKIIDSLFNKKDIENILNKNEVLNKWKSNVIINKDINIKYVHIGGNYISRPYYRIDNKFAIVLHYFKGNSTMFIFQNNNKSNWELFSRIDNLWW